MLVTKCDICKKEIKGETTYASMSGYWDRRAFCSKCGKPVTDFLNKYRNIINNKNGKQKGKK
ncbi:MAG: hypothetical protein Q8R34_00110 [bacterium]|nr:hypothetical protein [bacterium]